MNSKTRIALAGAACVMGCAIAVAEPSAAPAQNPPAVVDSQVSGPPPSPAYVWMAGHWNSDGGQWKWVSAHWELPPTRSAVWVGGHWVSEGGSWVWVNGAWNVAEAPQTQAAPPQPPGNATQAQTQGPTEGGQLVPMPSTPAPYVEGEFGPGGSVRVIDQPPVTTDYGPIDYASPYAYDYPGYYYPGYYWPGDPWLWGGFFGFGWGPGYYGWGRGDSGHWHGGHGHVGRGFSGHGFSGHLGGHTH